MEVKTNLKVAELRAAHFVVRLPDSIGISSSLGQVSTSFRRLITQGERLLTIAAAICSTKALNCATHAA